VISKNISYSIIQGEFKLLNRERKKFAEVKIQKARGRHLIYKSREAKMDLDIDRILVKNFADANEEFRYALYPGSSQ